MCDFRVTRSAVTVLPLLYAKASSCSEAQNNNWTPCSLEDFACTLTTAVANRSVALGPLLFSLVLNRSTCLLRILAQMAVMLVWKGCVFSLSLWCVVHVLCTCTNACCASSNCCLAFSQSVFLFLPTSISLLPAIRRERTMHTPNVQCNRAHFLLLSR